MSTGVRLCDDEAWAFLERGHTGILTTLRHDGWPVSLPIWFAVVDRRIYVGTPAASMKVTRLRADDRGCFLVETGEAWVELAAVELPVRASMVDDLDEAAAAGAAMTTKYRAFRPAPKRVPSATKRHYSGQALLRLDPAGPFISWDNSRIRLRVEDRSGAEA